MLYRDDSSHRIERRLELFLGPALVFIAAVAVGAYLLSRSTGF